MGCDEIVGFPEGRAEGLMDGSREGATEIVGFELGGTDRVG